MKSQAIQYNPRDIAEYNPSDLANLVRNRVQELMNRPPYPLVLPGPFPGAGIYALFYDGDFAFYQHPLIRSPDAKRPIYVGRARLTKSSGPRPLYNRLHDHAKSIEATATLSIEDFRCRFLVLHPLWVSTVEDLLIEHYIPLWNEVLEGFGVHDPGGKRYTEEVSLWDVLHPGRAHQKAMVAKGAKERDVSEVVQMIQDYVSTHTPPGDIISLEEVQTAALTAAAEDEAANRDDGE